MKLRIECPRCKKHLRDVEGNQEGISHVMCDDCAAEARAEVEADLDEQDEIEKIKRALGREFEINGNEGNND